MTGTTKTQFSIWAAFMVASIGTAIAASGAVQAGNAPAQCEIAASPAGGGMVSIEALAHIQDATRGSYSLTITGAGANISQGGDFDARAGETVMLGSAALGGSARGYDVTLAVTAGGKTAQCSERVFARS